MIRQTFLGLTGAACASTGAALAQGINRPPLQKIDFPAGYTTVPAIAEIAAGGSAGRHTHPGVETGYVIEGESDLNIEGQPTKHFKPRHSWAIPPGTIHDGKGSGGKTMKIIAVYIVEKNKTLGQPPP